MLLVFLKSNREIKIKNGYPNVFRDEIKNVEGKEEDGAICNVFSQDYQFLGKGFYSKSNVAVRMLTTKDEEIDTAFFITRVKTALRKREAYFTDSYRLLHAEADQLPGVIADKYGDYLAIQIRNIGMERYKELLITALVEVIKPRGIFERSDFESSQADILTRHVGLLYGELPPDQLIIEEHGIKYKVDIKKGQKTGFFFDQRDSRLWVRKLTPPNALALDAFAYTGGFALNMAKAGAAKVIALDKDQDSVNLGLENAALNKLSNVEFINTYYEDYLKDYKGPPFDIIVLDPPALIKKKEDKKKGLTIFQNIVSLARPHLKKEGILGLCSCAFAADLDLLINALRRAYFESEQSLQVLGVTYQSLDHPWNLFIPESLYLKCLWVKVC
mgnify:CR=1 FL=1